MPQTWPFYPFYGMNFGMATFHSDFTYVRAFLHRGDIFFQILYTFLIILHPSGAQKSSFLHILCSFKKLTQKMMPSDAGICVRKG